MLFQIPSGQGRYLASLLFPIGTGSDHCIEFLPDHPTDRRDWPISREAVRYCWYLLGFLNYLGRSHSIRQATLSPNRSILPVWISIPPHWHVAFRSESQWPILDAKCRDWLVRGCICKRLFVLCV
jgi:hypothetical protein